MYNGNVLRTWTPVEEMDTDLALPAHALPRTSRRTGKGSAAEKMDPLVDSQNKTLTHTHPGKDLQSSSATRPAPSQRWLATDASKDYKLRLHYSTKTSG